MRQFLMIPDMQNLRESVSLAETYGLGFEYNDFFHPDVLDDEERLQRCFAAYQAAPQPKYCTLHGAFLDVIPFSPDR